MPIITQSRRQAIKPFNKPLGAPRPVGPGGPNKFRKDGPGGGGNFRDRKRNENDPFNINESIRAREVRVIGPDGKMLGVYPTAQALSLARDFGLDLIEVAPEASPPTCKIMDYGKWKYENKKKNQANKKKQVTVTVKEIQIRPRTDEHDLEVKMRHARRFLLEGDKVKINMRFQGREMAYQDQGRAVMDRVVKTLSELGIVEAEPKSEGKQLFTIVGPDAVKIKEFRAKNPDNSKKVAADHEEMAEDKHDEGDE